MISGPGQQFSLGKAPLPSSPRTTKIVRLSGPWTVRLLGRDGKELDAPWYSRRLELPARWKAEGPGGWHVAFATIVNDEGDVLWLRAYKGDLMDGDELEIEWTLPESD